MLPDRRATLAALIDEQRVLEVALGDVDPDPHALLAVGDRLLQFAMHEEQILEMTSTLLDPVAQGALAREHEEFATDLELLRWLVETIPDSADIAVLTASLLRRIRQHVARDGRLLARVVELQP